MNFPQLKAPNSDFSRSQVAEKIARVAAESGLFLQHFEYRKSQELPEEWQDPSLEELQVTPNWQGGILPEGKYASFRHDSLLGTFHPNHLARWGAHELCHGLLGFAWKPGATPFFHALAARIAELLPVAVFYFYDEASFKRCPIHESAPQYSGFYCPDCEKMPEKNQASPRNILFPEALEEGNRYVQRELAAIQKSLKTGRMHSHVWGNLNLASDAISYVRSHFPRLNSKEFHAFMERFWPTEAGFGRHNCVDSLMERLQEMNDFFLDKSSSLPPLKGNSFLYIRQEIAWRLYQIMPDCDEDVKKDLDGVLERLETANCVENFTDAHARYLELTEEWVLPDPETIFGIGAPQIGNIGLALEQVQQGITSALPHTAPLLFSHAGFFPHFVKWDLENPIRRPLGERVALHTERSGNPLSAQVLLESTLTHIRPQQDDFFVLSGYKDNGQYCLNPGATLLKITPDSAFNLELTDTLQEEALYAAIIRGIDGQVIVHNIGKEAFVLLQSREHFSNEDIKIPKELWLGLRQEGIVVPTGFRA